MIEFETERLYLRRLVPQDAPFILELLTDPSFTQNIGDRGLRTVADAEAYLEKGPQKSYAEHGFGMYGVESRAHGILLGICGLVKRAGLDGIDIGFAFLPLYWGQGFALESAQVIVEQAKDLGHPKLLGITKGHNLPSIRLVEKLGLRFQECVKLPGSEEEVLVYSLQF